MDRILSVAQVIAPIFIAIFLGICARKKSLLTPEEVRGLQQFVIKFGIPCLLFNSCLTANVSAESLSTMVLLVPMVLAATLWSFHARKKSYPYHNFPQLFCAKETGMLGIPLFMILFGATEAYRMGVLDLAQGIISIPVVSMLAATTGQKLSVGQMVKKLLTAPMLIFSILGLVLNLTGIRDILNQIGIGQIITESTTFLGQPVSALMLFTVGYNFSLGSRDRKTIFRISAIHFVMYIFIGIVIQLALFLVPSVDPLSRWAVAMYATLPASYLAPAVGRTEEDFTVASGVCSILSIFSLLAFCVMAAFVV